MTAVWGPNVTMGFWGLYWEPYLGPRGLGPRGWGPGYGAYGIAHQSPWELLGSCWGAAGMAHGIPHQLMGLLMRSTVWGDGGSLGIGYLG